jgi:hypothetical protein
MAVQANNLKILKWAIDTSRTVAGASPDLAMTPEYYGAFMSYGTGHYPQAKQGFELLFLSGPACDTAAQAGLMLAEVDTHLDDYVGAKVVLDMVEELFPDQTAILAKANALKNKVMHVVPKLDPQVAANYREVHYGSRLAELKKERSPQAMPMQQASAAPLRNSF